MKILTVVGARPQFVKASVFSREIVGYDQIQEVIVHTGQHYDNTMSGDFFKDLEIPIPKYNLNVGSGNPGWQTGEMVIKIEETIIYEKPDFVLVYGDTNSTLAGAIAAAKQNINVIHIESGYRNYNPIVPEEQNRLLTDHLSTYLFCPTNTTVENLKKENIYDGKIMTGGRKVVVRNTGDIMYDAFMYNKKISDKKSNVLSKLELKEKEYVLLTIHRPHNTDPNIFKKILKGLEEIDKPILFPVHPRTQSLLNEMNINLDKKIILTQPQGYLDMIAIESGARAIITDSGGVQKEAFFLSTPCITLNNYPDNIETTDGSMNIYMHEEDYYKISPLVFRNIEPPKVNPFGDGNCARKIIKCLLE